jgi:hypothetical protein
MKTSRNTMSPRQLQLNIPAPTQYIQGKDSATGRPINPCVISFVEALDRQREIERRELYTSIIKLAAHIG